MDSTSDHGGRLVPERGKPGRTPPPQPVHRLATLGEDVRGRELPPPRYAGSIPFTTAVLERHGAVVLRPAEVTLVAGRPAPRPTAYRAGVLLVAEDVAQDDEFLRTANTALESLGVSLVKPRRISESERLGRYRDRLADLPRPVAIVVNRQAGPRRVDAWQVLQTLRVAGTVDRARPGAIGLDHLLVGSAMVSIGGSPGAVEGSPGAVEGSNGPAVYLRPGTGGRVPVAVALAPPRSSPTSRRRPVVAVLDTGMSPHPWLTGVVEPDEDVQAAVLAAEEVLQASQQTPVQMLADAWDTPFDDQDFVQDIDTHAGHGTFISGLVRQVAPDARVIAIRIMHPDGVVYEGDLLAALRTLRLRMEDAVHTGSPDGVVDVVSLSLGYFDERTEDDPDGVYTSALATEINGLAACGVLVVAAAGNFSTDRPFYPAAFAAAPPAAGPPVISVGAWNPNGSKALFSDDGQWVTGWALGAALVSTYPNFQGATQPEMGQESGRRQTLDTDDYSGGFAVWSGTSFAGPLLAAEVAELLFAYSEQHVELSLDTIDAEAAMNRVGNVLDALRKQG
jgi:subtilisin family serine protease